MHSPKSSVELKARNLGQGRGKGIRHNPKSSIELETRNHEQGWGFKGQGTAQSHQLS